jgi:hypothetical protein
LGLGLLTAGCLEQVGVYDELDFNCGPDDVSRCRMQVAGKPLLQKVADHEVGHANREPPVFPGEAGAPEPHFVAFLADASGQGPAHSFRHLTLADRQGFSRRAIVPHENDLASVAGTRRPA